jgi:hypothetical protein
MKTHPRYMKTHPKIAAILKRTDLTPEYRKAVE